MTKVHQVATFYELLESHSLKGALIIVDKVLLKNAFLKPLLKAPGLYPVTAGEGLKDTKSFHKHIAAILKITQKLDPKTLEVWSMGGGSVGDFSGFVASVLKRGRPLHHIPSTWLAAVDSAHGGKTALNVGDVKNAIGTYHPSTSTWLVQELLLSQPPARFEESMAEVFKVALLLGEPWANLFFKETVARSPESLFRILPKVIAAKLKIVRKDPLEQKGHRKLLNLGHTVAHGLELKNNLPHGLCVGVGLDVTLLFSRLQGHLSKQDHTALSNQLYAVLPYLNDIYKNLKPLTQNQWQEIFKSDKKSLSEGQILEPVVCGWGHCQLESIKVRGLMVALKQKGLWL